MILGSLLGFKLIESLEVAFSLHLASGFAALVYLYRESRRILFRPSPQRGKSDSPLTKLAAATLLSFAIAYPLDCLSRETLQNMSLDAAMGFIGVLLLVTGLLMSTRKVEFKNEPSLLDLLVAGIGQGFSILPGISRSGVTFSILLLLGVEKTSALLWSYFIGIPAVIAAGLYNFLKIETYISLELILASSLSAFFSGLASIGIMLKVSRKVRYEYLTVSLGLLYIFSSIILIIS